MSILMKSALLVAAWCACAFPLGYLVAAEEKPVDLKVGDKAPGFEAKDDQDKDWKSSEHVGKKLVVVYFYPADFTGGCTKEACGYRDDMQKLADKGVEVVGVSGDSVKNHDLFRKHHKLNFTLLADEDGAVAKKFGVPIKVAPGKATGKDAEGKDVELTRNLTESRWTFVIGKDGTILYKNTNVDASKDSQQLLEQIDKLQK